jgi:hypothetical protein
LVVVVRGTVVVVVVVVVVVDVVVVGGTGTLVPRVTARNASALANESIVPVPATCPLLMSAKNIIASWWKADSRRGPAWPSGPPSSGLSWSVSSWPALEVMWPPATPS